MNNNRHENRNENMNKNWNENKSKNRDGNSNENKNRNKNKIKNKNCTASEPTFKNYIGNSWADLGSSGGALGEPWAPQGPPR